jgi:glycosyltransferase involved in cell wall biosynthesis
MRLGDLQTAYLFYSQGLLGRLCYKILHAFEKATWKKVDRIIAISESFRRFLVKEGINPEKISVVGESIDISEFRSGADREDLRKKYALTDAPVLMFHGLISKIKGLDILLKAIPACRKTIPDLKIMLVGDGPQLNHLKKLSVKLGLASCVVFTGWVPFEQVPDYISACNIGLPLRSANLGNNFVVTTAFLQYAALKKPVIVPGLEAYKDTLADNPHQFIFDLNRPETLSGCIADLLNDKEKAARTCENNYKMALEKFAAVKIANELAREVLI